MKTIWLAPLIFLAFLAASCGPDGQKSASAPSPGAAEEPAVPPKGEEEEAIEELVFDFDGRRFDRVVSGAQEFAEKFPESPRKAQALYLSGRALISTGRFDEGIALLRELMEKYPDDENVPMADFHIAQGTYLKVHIPVSEYRLSHEEAIPQYEEALKTYQSAAEKNAGDDEVASRSRLMAAQVLYDLHRREEALAQFQASVDAQPGGDYADQALFQIGVILTQLDRPVEAKEAFQKLINAYPGKSSTNAAFDRMRELNLIGAPMPPIRAARWINRPANPPDFEGKVLVLTFWKRSCAHCRHEMPKLEALYKKLSKKGLVMVGLTNHSSGEDDGTLREYMAETGLTFPIGIDAQSMTAETYAVSRLPAVAIVDRKGIVRWRNSGDLVTESLLERFL